MCAGQTNDTFETPGPEAGPPTPGVAEATRRDRGGGSRRRLDLLRGIAIAALVALGALYASRLVKLPQGGFGPGSFVTHTLMLAASIGIIGLWRGKRFAEAGFTWGRYRFRPSILSGFFRQPCCRSWRLQRRGSAGPRVSSLIGGWGIASRTLVRFSLPVVVSALFFGAMHLVLIESMGPAAVVPIVLATLLGLVAARYREATGSIIPAIIVHALFNVGGMLPGWIVGWLGTP